MKHKKSEKNVVKKSKVDEALELPVICNMNPRSIYNKVNEFEVFVEQHEVDLVFMSESWERPEYPLKELINLKDFEIISNVSQRHGQGGRPALLVNKNKFKIKDITNTLVTIPWRVEAVWCLLSPKHAKSDSKIKKIACCALYSKPQSRKKAVLLDHISDTYDLLKTKYDGLHFIIAGDSNDLKIDAILNLDKKFVQVVRNYTRLNPPAILDTVIQASHY